KAGAAELSEKLEARGFSATPLSGDLNQALRERTINRLKEGLVDIVVATDVAARGLDVDRISHVTNYDVPYDTESYVHRIGRTGRAGRDGNAILFITPRERSMLKAIERATRQPIMPMELPTNAQIQDKRVRDFKEKLLETLRGEELERFSLLVETWCNEESLEMSDLASALLFLAQKENPLYEEIQEIPTPHERPERRDRGDRSFERKARSHRDDRDEEDPFQAEEGFDRYYLGVGRQHRINPGDIVGAIANETGINSQDIGRIKLHPFFSTVDLPQGIPNDLLTILRRMTIRGNPSKFRIMTNEPPPREHGHRQEDGRASGRFGKGRFPRKPFGKGNVPKGGFGGKRSFGKRGG
ncbi:MAG TPA: helicase-related protein, partial [Fibrobacteraceae bacterium]|nr:helicase-related protein [Fibrobacteraceae bacterium]